MYIDKEIKHISNIAWKKAGIMSNITYKEIYRTLNNNGIIDNIINKYSAMENTQLVKSDIFDGIDYATSFFKSSSFKNMTYYWEPTEKIDYLIAQEICKEFSKIKLAEIAEMEKEAKYFEYMTTL